MWTIVAVTRVVLALLAFRGIRWAYLLFILLGLEYFPASVGYQFHPRACELTFSTGLALFSFTNYAHIVLFAIFFLMTCAQFPGRLWSDRAVLAPAALIGLTMGALVEIAEGLTGNGHCRLRDLIPDAAGMALAALGIIAWSRITRRGLAS
jgi:hypothetical protein